MWQIYFKATIPKMFHKTVCTINVILDEQTLLGRLAILLCHETVELSDKAIFKK